MPRTERERTLVCGACLDCPAGALVGDALAVEFVGLPLLIRHDLAILDP
jgi:hypothetical protein